MIVGGNILLLSFFFEVNDTRLETGELDYLSITSTGFIKELAPGKKAAVCKSPISQYSPGIASLTVSSPALKIFLFATEIDIDFLEHS